MTTVVRLEVVDPVEGHEGMLWVRWKSRVSRSRWHVLDGDRTLCGRRVHGRLYRGWDTTRCLVCSRKVEL
jgi:hypothetical protein